KLADPQCQARRALLRLPSRLGGFEEVQALLVREGQDVGDPERVLFFKDWARGEGFAALSVFMNKGRNDRPGCILSVTPASQASLEGLWEQLEQAESARRRELHGGQDDRLIDPKTGLPLRRRESAPGAPPWPNAAPWYDGRSHGGTIRDAPTGGPALIADEIEEIFLRFGAADRAEPLGPAASPTPRRPG